MRVGFWPCGGFRQRNMHACVRPADTPAQQHMYVAEGPPAGFCHRHNETPLTDLLVLWRTACDSVVAALAHVAAFGAARVGVPTAQRLLLPKGM